MSIGIERSKIFELAFMWIQMNEKIFVFRALGADTPQSTLP